MASLGWSWGIADGGVNVLEYGWDGSDQGAGGSVNAWKVKETVTNADWDSALGDLRLVIGDEFVSAVVDKGDTNTKLLSITENHTTNELINVQWRGRDTSFDQDDDENDGPDWEDYPAGGANKNWRYLQVKVACYEKIIMDSSETVVMDGEEITM